MKKLFSVVLTCLMLFSGAPAVMAAGTAQVSVPAASSNGGGVFVGRGSSSPVSSGSATISQEQALAIAEGIFPDLKSKNVQAQQEIMQTPRWMLSWNAAPAAGGGTYRGDDVMIDAVSGTLDNFQVFDWNADQTGSPLITGNEALQKAEAFIEQHYPGALAQAVLSNETEPNLGPYKMVSFTYNFTWNRMEQGIPVLGDSLQLGVDPFSGRIVTGSYNWHPEAAFPEAATVSAAREAQLMNQLGVILCYQVQPGQVNAQGVPEATPVYRFNCSPELQIDPASGNALTDNGNPAPLQGYALIPGPAPAVSSAVYSGEPTVGPAQQVSQDVAEQNAERFFQALGLSGPVTDNGGGGSSFDGVFSDQTWSFTLQSGSPASGMMAMQPPTVGIDAATGEVSNYFNPSSLAAAAAASGTPAQNGSPALTQDAARDKALAFIQQISPEKVGQLVAASQPEFDYYNGDTKELSVSFMRLINGIPFPRDGISMAFDQSGNIVNYSCNWHRVAIAPVAQLITADQAQQILMQNNPLEAEYVFPQSLAPSGAVAGGKEALSAAPVFALTYQGGGVAADTGKLVSLGLGLYGLGLGSGQQQAAVIPAGHWAVAPLTILADSGVLPTSGFKPDGPVTRREALQVLVGSFGSGMIEPAGTPSQSAFQDVALDDPDYQVVQSAVDRGVIDPGPDLNPDGTITRAAFVEWLVRALGYRYVAEMPASITLKFSDVQQLSNTDRNYLAIAEGLGVVKGGPNVMFHPDAPLTWAELASMVTEAAPRLQMI